MLSRVSSLRGRRRWFQRAVKLTLVYRPVSAHRNNPDATLQGHVMVTRDNALLGIIRRLSAKKREEKYFIL